MEFSDYVNFDTKFRRRFSRDWFVLCDWLFDHEGQAGGQQANEYLSISQSGAEEGRESNCRVDGRIHRKGKSHNVEKVVLCQVSLGA